MGDNSVNLDEFDHKVIGDRLYLIHRTEDFVLVRDGDWGDWKQRTSLVDGYWMQTIIRALPKMHINQLGLNDRLRY